MNDLGDTDGQLKKKNCCQQYFIVDPTKNKLLPFWRLIFMGAIICELALVPYTACLGIEKFYRKNLQREQVIDIIWMLNIIISFCTATVRDGQLEREFKSIAKRYLTGTFAFDIVSMFPTIILY